MSDLNRSSLQRSQERRAASMSGYVMLLIALVALAAVILGASLIRANPRLGVPVLAVAMLALVLIVAGFYMLQPNQAAAITLFGDYKGTDRTPGLRWVLPWHARKKIVGAREQHHFGARSR